MLIYRIGNRCREFSEGQAQRNAININPQKNTNLIKEYYMKLF